MNAKPFIILLAEDDPDDCYLIGEALDESRIENRLYIVEDGEQLLDYLYHRGKYSDLEQWPAPSLLLLDLNMPLKDGREALAEIRTDPNFRRLPIVVLTTSKADEDILRTYDLGINGYITKPVTFTGLKEVMQALGKYWLDIVELPPP